MLLAIDIRERWVVADMVSKGVDGGDTLPGLIEPRLFSFTAQIVAGLVQLWSRSSRFRCSTQHEKADRSVTSDNPDDVSISAELVRNTIDERVTGDFINMEFQTVPEPSSIVLAASGALVLLAVAMLLAVALARSRQADHPRPTLAVLGIGLTTHM